MIIRKSINYKYIFKFYQNEVSKLTQIKINLEDKLKRIITE